MLEGWRGGPSPSSAVGLPAIAAELHEKPDQGAGAPQRVPSISGRCAIADARIDPIRIRFALGWGSWMHKLIFAFPLLLVAEAPADKERLLLEAIHNGDVRAVRSVLKAGADANTTDELGSTALMHA